MPVLLASLGLLLAMWLLRPPAVVQATASIEGDPISFGGVRRVVTASVGVRAVAVGELDRDGRPDLVFADGQWVRIAPNVGVTGTAWVPSNTVGAMGAPVVDVAVADWDRDGCLDLAAAATDGAGNSRIVLWQGPGPGSNPFTATWGVSNTLIASLPITLSTLAVGDLNGDGAPDLIAAGGDGLIRMWANPMTETQPFTTSWGAPHLLNAHQGGINRVLLADFGRDGRPDIVAVSGGGTPTVRLWRNPLTATSPFTTPWTVSNTLGTFADDVRSVVVADLDGDGRLDVGVGRDSGDVMVWRNPLTVALPFTTSWGSPASVGSGDRPLAALASADFDRDGLPDLVGGVEGPSPTLFAWHNPGAPFGGGWTTTTLEGPTGSVYDVAVADFDPDGDMDVAAGYGDAGQGWVSLWANTLLHRDAAFENLGIAVGPMDSARGMVVGDLDRDGRTDIVANQGGGYMRAWQNDGTPFDGTWPQYHLGWSSNSVPRALADLDRDGDLDIVAVNWCEPPAPHVEVWRNDGDPFAGEWTTVSAIGDLPTFATAITVGDLDRNGTPEIVVGIDGNSSVSPTIGIWRFEGDPFVATSWLSSEVAVVSYTVNSIALGDLNNDGWPDIVFGTDHAPPADPMPEVYQLRAARNDGAPFDGGWTLFDLGRDPQWTGLEPSHGYRGETVHSVGLADFDNDGDLDIVTGEAVQGDHQIMVWENDGTPFDGEQWQPTTVGLGPYWEPNGNPWLADTVFSVVPADLNNDGLIDLVSGSGPTEPYEVIYWENSGLPFSALVTDTHWIRHDVGAVEMHVKLVGAVDLDGDGDIDIASLAETWSSPVEVVHVWQNREGTVGERVEATAPVTMAEGSVDDLLRIVVSHHGKPAEPAVEIDEWRVTFTDGAGTPLISAQADGLFASIAVYRDGDGDGMWQGSDTPVVTVSSPSLVDGVQRLPFPSGDPLAVISATETVTYFVVVSLEPDASLQTPALFRIHFDADAASVVRDRATSATVSINDTHPVSASVEVVSAAMSVTVEAVPDTLPADGVSTSVVTATVEDGEGHGVADGTAVVFTATLGSFPTEPYTATTVGGVATATLRAGTEAGTTIVWAYAGEASGQALVTLQQVEYFIFLPTVLKGP